MRFVGADDIRPYETVMFPLGRGGACSSRKRNRRARTLYECGIMLEYFLKMLDFVGLDGRKQSALREKEEAMRQIIFENVNFSVIFSKIFQEKQQNRKK